ncbi:MAG: TIGR03067 domain-containing protein [Pirellulales bacterium]
MKLLSLAALAACALLLPGLVDARAADADQEKLQGKWKVESFEFNGAPVDALKDAVRDFKDEKYSLTPASGEVFNGTVKLDSSKNPKQIDLLLNDRTLKGIYEIDGDTLKIAYALEGDERPTEFTSKPDSGVVLATHKRAK